MKRISHALDEKKSRDELRSIDAELASRDENGDQ